MKITRTITKTTVSAVAIIVSPAVTSRDCPPFTVPGELDDAAALKEATKRYGEQLTRGEILAVKEIKKEVVLASMDLDKFLSLADVTPVEVGAAPAVLPEA